MSMINLRIQAPEVQRLSPKITVVGVGGAGGNAVNNMISSGLEGCEFLVTNTDAQALEGSLCENRLQLGASVTGGLGAGARPEVGAKAAEESLEDVMAYLTGSNMVFITAGMGGGTGTGAAPVIARACRDNGILTVGVVTKPFHFEGTHRMRQADAGIAQMQDYVDTLIVIPNQNLFRVANEKTTFAEAFRMADSVLQSGVRGVTDLMIMPGMINLDFSDIRSAMLEMGKAMMGTGEGEGERRAIEAAEAAINNPLLDDISMKGARGVIINVTGGTDLTLFEVDEACGRIRDEVDPNANIIFGSTFDDKLEGRMRVSIVATGIDVEESRQAGPVAAPAKVAGLGKSLPQSDGGKSQGGLAADRGRTSSPISAPIQSPPLASRAAIPPRQMPVFPPTPGKPVVQAPLDTDVFVPQSQAQPVSGEGLMAGASALSSAVSQASHAAGLRGTLHEGHFIPPKPILPVQQETPVTTYAGYAGGIQTGNSGALQPQKRPVSYEEPLASAVAVVPATSETTERKKAPSLFERITSGVRREHARRAAESAAEAKQEPSQPTMGSDLGDLHTSLRTTPRMVSDAPAQGQLAIDSPAVTRAKSEEELDIPAFLRRQAN